MIRKKVYLLFSLLLIAAFSCKQGTPATNKKAAANGQRESYYFPVPAGWSTELMHFPIDFAPEINYTGTEDLRFAKGWGDIISEEHWSYAFTWWLDGKPEIDGPTLQKDLTAYYIGLVGRNIVQGKIPESQHVPTVVTISRVEHQKGTFQHLPARLACLIITRGSRSL